MYVYVISSFSIVIIYMLKLLNSIIWPELVIVSDFVLYWCWYILTLCCTDITFTLLTAEQVNIVDTLGGHQQQRLMLKVCYQFIFLLPICSKQFGRCRIIQNSLIADHVFMLHIQLQQLNLF